MAQTALSNQMERLCLLALDNPKGIGVDFKPEQYGPLPTCKAKARSFTQYFSAFRANERSKLARKMRKDGVPGEATHRFDALLCQTSTLLNDTGYRVSILLGAVLDDSLSVVDLNTERPHAEFGSHKSLQRRLVEKLTDYPQYWTDEDMQQLLECDAGFLEPFNGERNNMLNFYGDLQKSRDGKLQFPGAPHLAEFAIRSGRIKLVQTNEHTFTPEQAKAKR